MPTSLLDWTDDPHVAAFFAVDESAIWNGRPTDDDVCVWALNRPLVTTAMNPAVRTAGPVQDLFAIGFMRCRRSRHHFLHAQSGLFSWVFGWLNHYLTTGTFPDVPTLLGYLRVDGKEPLLKKILLRKDRTIELARLLARKRINRARLMPTLDNVAATVRVLRALQG